MLTSTSSDAAILRSSASAGWPCLWRQTAAATRWVCIDSASAVEPQWCAISRRIWQTSPCVAPPPPSSDGTSADISLRLLELGVVVANEAPFHVGRGGARGETGPQLLNDLQETAGGCHVSLPTTGLVFAGRPHKFEKWTAAGGLLRARRGLCMLDGMSVYGQFCPVAQALEVVGERWTLLIVRELLCGNYRFGEILHGVPLMSRSLLSQRLKALEDAAWSSGASAPPATATSIA